MPRDAGREEADLRALLTGLRTPEAERLAGELPEPVRTWVRRLRELSESVNARESLVNLLAESASTPRGIEAALDQALGEMAALPGLGGLRAQLARLTAEVEAEPGADEPAPDDGGVEGAIDAAVRVVERAVRSSSRGLLDEATQALTAMEGFAESARRAPPALVADQARELQRRVRQLEERLGDAGAEVFAGSVLPVVELLADAAQKAGDPRAVGMRYLHAAVAEAVFSVGLGADPTPLWQRLFDDALEGQAFVLAETAADRLRAAAGDAGRTEEWTAISRRLADSARAGGAAQVAAHAELDETIAAADLAHSAGRFTEITAGTRLDAEVADARLRRAIEVALARRDGVRFELALEGLLAVLVAAELRSIAMQRLVEAQDVGKSFLGPIVAEVADRRLGQLRDAWGEAALVAEIERFRARLR